MNPADPNLNDPVPGVRRWLKLIVAYDGTDYAGWQYQPNQPTVQGVLAEAWQRITGEQPSLTASGRTDAGVHAEGQVVGVDTLSQLPPERLLRALNAVLPSDIVVRQVEVAPENFHATYDALKKLYRYRLHNDRVRPLMDRRYVWHYPQGLDLAAMQQAASHLVGRHDFACFETAGSERTTTVRTLTQVEVTADTAHKERIEIDVEGDGFLYNMVRGIVGTLVEVGRGARQPEWICEVLASRDRRCAGPNAPALGLTLMRVDYSC